MANYNYPYPRPALTVDAVLFRGNRELTEVLLIQRKYDPFKEKWAFPGGFVEENERVEDAILREVEEETNLTGIPLQQFYTASTPGRDPRGWTVSVVFFGKVLPEINSLRAGDDAAEAKWFPVDNLPELAFDHDEIFNLARKIFFTSIK